MHIAPLGMPKGSRVLPKMTSTSKGNGMRLTHGVSAHPQHLAGLLPEAQRPRPLQGIQNLCNVSLWAAKSGQEGQTV